MSTMVAKTLNPYGKIVEEVFIPKNRSFYKEVCDCTSGAPKHWNIVYQVRKGKEIEEVIFMQSGNEKLIDYCMDIICDEGLVIDWTI